MNRIVVVGSSGSGKTTIARRIATTLDIPLLELDAVMHDGGWDATPDEEFRNRVEAFTAADRWVVDGNYASRGMTEVLWPKADTFVWVDPPKRVAVARVIRRTLKRMIIREKLWDGELTEPLSNLYRLDPYQNIIVWTWTTFDRVRETFEQALGDGSWDHATVHRLQTPQEIRTFFDGIA